MPDISALSSLLSGVFESETVLHECRHCGTMLEDADGRCTECGRDAVATFEVAE